MEAFSITGLKSVTIPDSVTYIGGDAFCQTHLSGNLVIPNSVTYIGWNAFSGCSGLTSVSIGNSVTTIASGAFYNCNGLTELRIPDSVKTIGLRAFAYCTGLTSLSIPGSVTAIGEEAFRACTRLKDMYCEIMRPQDVDMGRNCFREMHMASCILHVPKGKAASYRATAQWQDFKYMVDDINVRGDVNSDGEIAVADVTALVDCVLTGRHSESSDVNGDGETNVADVTALVSMVMGE